MLDGFFDVENRLEVLSQQGDPLEVLNRVVPWDIFRETLEQVRMKDRKSKAGRKPFDVVLMFKILILQSMYNLSDDAVEYQICDRLSFMRFLDLSLGARVPDAKTEHRASHSIPCSKHKPCWTPLHPAPSTSYQAETPTK